MKVIKKFISLLMVSVICLSTLFCINTFAATFGGENTKTIHVETKADWSKPGSESITLAQNKATYTYQKFSFGKGWVSKKGSIYPTYNITIYNITKNKVNEKTWKSSSIKLNLDRDCNYSITVAYDDTSTWLRSNCKSGNYNSGPYWYVKKTHKVSSCT